MFTGSNLCKEKDTQKYILKNVLGFEKIENLQQFEKHLKQTWIPQKIMRTSKKANQRSEALHCGWIELFSSSEKICSETQKIIQHLVKMIAPQYRKKQGVRLIIFFGDVTSTVQNHTLLRGLCLFKSKHREHFSFGKFLVSDLTLVGLEPIISRSEV